MTDTTKTIELEGSEENLGLEAISESGNWTIQNDDAIDGNEGDEGQYADGQHSLHAIVLNRSSHQDVFRIAP